MTARIAVITGASDGIGAAAARQLSANGDQVVVVGRSATKTAAVAADLRARHFVADFTKLAEVRALAAELLADYPQIDVLVNNAGGIMGKRQETTDGHEKTFQVNHLAPFLLTNLLIGRLVESNAKVINTSSAANKIFGRLNIEDLDARQKYSANRAYGNGKLANILFTRELHRRFNPQGIQTAAFHPGVVATSFAADSTSIMRLMYRTPFKRVLLTAEQGADTLVWLADSVPGTDWVSGEYYENRKLSQANDQAYDADLARQLWERSAAMVGLDERPAV